MSLPLFICSTTPYPRARACGGCAARAASCAAPALGAPTPRAPRRPAPGPRASRSPGACIVCFLCFQRGRLNFKVTRIHIPHIERALVCNKSGGGRTETDQRNGQTRTHAPRTHARAAQTNLQPRKNACACLAYVTTLVTISAEAKGIYRPGQRAAGAAGSEPVHRLDQSDRISCTDSVKPLRALGANSTSCVCMVWVGVRAAGLLARGGDKQSTRGQGSRTCLTCKERAHALMFTGG